MATGSASRATLSSMERPRPRPRRATGRPRTSSSAIADARPGDRHRPRDQPTTRARRLEGARHSTGPIRPSSTISPDVDQALGLVGGRKRPSAGSATRPSSSTSRTARRRAASSSSRPTRPRPKRLFTQLRRTLVGLGGDQLGVASATRPTTGTTITTVDLGVASRPARSAGAPARPSMPCRRAEGDVEIAYAATDDVVVIGSARPSSSTSSTRPGDLARPATTATSRSSTGSGKGTSLGVRRHRGDPRPGRGRDGQGSDPAKYSEVRRTRKPFLARSTPSSRRIGRGPISPQHGRHHGQVRRGVAQRPTAQEQEEHAHGSPHPADARRRDQAADLSRRRRRRPQRPRRPRDRDASATTTRAPIRSSSRSTPTRRRRGSPRAPSRRTPSPACSATRASCPRPSRRSRRWQPRTWSSTSRSRSSTTPTP